MKRILLSGFAALILLGILVSKDVFTAAARIVEHKGQLIDTMVNADSDTKLSEKFVLARTGESGDLGFDEVLLGFDIPNMDSIQATGDVNAVDSVIVRVITGSGANTDT